MLLKRKLKKNGNFVGTFYLKKECEINILENIIRNTGITLKLLNQY